MPVLETGTVTTKITAFQTPYLKKSGRVVDFRCEFNGGYSINTNTLVAVIPAGFRPSVHRIILSVPVDGGSGVQTGHGEAIISMTGDVTINVDKVGLVCICATWLIE